MAKGLPIEPRVMLSTGALHLPDIPVNAYQKPLQEERSRYTTEELVDIWLDMCAIREFETILNELKLKGTYRGVAYDHAGPAHLSIGQEAAAVGMAFSLTPEDHIFGSHRSHGEILAKAFSAMRFLSDEQLEKIMRSYREGAVLAQVEGSYDGSMVGLAMRFFVYGAYGEIFARDTGLNRGLGGSMHAFFPPFGIYPNNAIVGGSASIAPGAALFKRVNRKPGIVVANIGDAVLWLRADLGGHDLRGHGPVPKALGPGPGRRPPPDLQLDGQLLRHGRPDVRGDHGLRAHRPVGGRGQRGADARRAGQRLRPARRHRRLPAQAGSDARRARARCCLDTVTYRFSGHSPSDASSYRTAEEVEHWQSARPDQLLPPAPYRRRGGQGRSARRGRAGMPPRGSSRCSV